MGRSSAKIGWEESKVLLEVDGKLVLDCPYDVAIEIARQLFIAAKHAEEWANHDNIVLDSAILMRSGAPFTLTNNPAMLDEAATEAAWNTTLRRNMGNDFRGKFGTPTVSQPQQMRVPFGPQPESAKED